MVLKQISYITVISYEEKTSDQITCRRNVHRGSTIIEEQIVRGSDYLQIQPV